MNKINTDLDNFIYTASHDLKAPVSNIEGLVNALEDVQKEQGSEPKEIVNLIKKSIIRFKNTIQDLTDISKIQKNFEIYQEFINVDTVINEVMDDLKFPLEESGGEIIKELKEKTLFFSKPNLKSIIYNLISNAIKYRKPNQKLICHIRFYSEGNKIILEVEDNGLGIPKNLQDKVFGMFKRVHTHVEGSGIGLYIVKRMVENGGARIELYSDEGLGCKFRIIFDKNVN